MEYHEAVLVPGWSGSAQTLAQKVRHGPAQRDATQLRLAGGQFHEVIVERQCRSHSTKVLHGHFDVKPRRAHHSAGMSDVTQILAAVRAGDDAAADRLFELVYAELRQVAAQKMSRESPGHTLQPTALVHEAWLRLGADAQPHWQNRAHFFAAAAEAMRRIASHPEEAAAKAESENTEAS